MASEDYMIGNTNISVIAKQAKQQYGNFNKNNALKELSKYKLDLIVGEQCIRFKLNDIKYVYWSKKNRVYRDKENLNLTLHKFIKEYKQYFILKDSSDNVNYIKEKTKELLWDSKITFGKYKGETFKYIFKYNKNYLVWLKENTTDIELKELLNKNIK